TKLDADARGGAALSVAYTIKKPILFLGIGQKYEDLILFEPSFVLNKLIN
ncbi:MAG: signal recognition particle-docking protein FtsY, partial [Candidatus Bathyarchaeia archaeon]